MFSVRRTAVVVEDEAMSRTLLTSLLSGLGFDVTTAATVGEGIDEIQAHDPDLVVVDLDLGTGPPGTHLIRWVNDNASWVGVVVLSAHRSTQLVDPRPLPPSDRRVHVMKDDLTSVDVLSRAIENCLAAQGGTRSNSGTTPTISRDQAHVLQLMAQGLSNSEIAKTRDCSVRTVENMIQRIYTTLGLKGDDSINPRVAAINMYNNSQVTVG
ncbi:MAG: response regulator [Candidatus Nanopelagicales bacterium]